jgi:hypothetical protein
MILTNPVLLYQLVFVLILYLASKFGRTPLTIALICCLLWTAIHLFFPPLMVFQAIVILLSYFWFRRRKAPTAS